MKKRLRLLLLSCIGISLIGCNQEETIKASKEIQADKTKINLIEEKPFTVEARQSKGYKIIKEVVRSDEIETVIEIVKNAEWEENIKVGMAFPPEYRFSLGAINYAVWMTPNRDRLEIIAEGHSKYIKLSIKDSEILFNIITEKELNIKK